MTARASPPGSLTVRLRRANGRELLSLVEVHGAEFQLKDVRQILLNPYCDRRVIEELLCIRSLMSIYEVRVALCRHRHTPHADAMRHLSGLFWRDLVEITRDQRLSIALRRVAGRYVVQRLPRLSSGEKMSLARRASPEIVSELMKTPDLRIVAAIFDNPRLTVETLLPLASDTAASPQKLNVLATHPRWGRPYEIRAALGRNPQVPFRIHFAVLPELRREDLEEIAALEAHSSVVRQRARDLLELRRVAANGPGGLDVIDVIDVTDGDDSTS